MALLIPWRSSPALGGSRAARRAIRPTKPQQDPQRYLESAVVRYSRVRIKEFTAVGVDRPPVRFSTIFWLRFDTTGELSDIPQYQLNATHRQRAATSSRKRHSHAPVAARARPSHIVRNLKRAPVDAGRQRLAAPAASPRVRPIVDRARTQHFSVAC